ncbi:MAG: hypothetical protein U5O39_01500 [Gammaproteobacteria bacterium]|nr:hypothetical protein [Gammaproteobacteria bacterium]
MATANQVYGDLNRAGDVMTVFGEAPFEVLFRARSGSRDDRRWRTGGYSAVYDSGRHRKSENRSPVGEHRGNDETGIDN